MLGDIVIVYGDGVKRNSWKMAVIEDLIQGKDNQVRGVKVRVITKVASSRRSVSWAQRDTNGARKKI